MRFDGEDTHYDDILKDLSVRAIRYWYTMTDRTNRRRILTGIGVAVTASLAGCNGTGNSADGGNGTDDSGGESGSGTDSSGDGSGNGTDSSGNENGETIENFPDGFSENGVSDFETAFGEGSAYRTQPHIQIEGESVQMSEDQTNTVMYSVQFDAEAERRLTNFETADGEVSSTQYLIEDTLYIRDVEGEEDPQYQVQETEFNRLTETIFNIEQRVAGEAEFESELTEQGLIRFTATKESYPEDHPITGLYSFNVPDAMLDVVLEIDESGLPQRFSARYENEEFSDELTYSFSYEEVTIEEPEWVSEAES